MCNRNPKKDQILCSIKGDKIDFSNEKRYSKVDVSTQLIAIEDLKERAKPDDLITDVTEGIDVRKMYSDVFRHFVKFYISTNFAPNFNNDSVKGRAKIFELANFFSAKLRPSEYFTYPNGAPVWFFGKNFTEKDWNEFYTFMINCADEYIQNGIIEAQDINFTERSLLQLTNEDFLYFIGEKFADNVENKTMGTFKKVPFNPATVFDNELFGQYMLKYDNTLAFTKDKSSFFWRWVREYCNKKSINYCEKKSVSEFYIYPDALTSQQCKMQKEKYKSKKTE
ncbi:hypothetical protein FACS18945_5270 [Bacteroidia bacterium]|nr:hypothetical protein FACS18945_5270 [Bacteroidia bacterium]